MKWYKLLSNDAFKEWLLATGTASKLPQGDFRLDTFASSLRKFNNAHSWLENLDKTGNFQPSARPQQAITDLSAIGLIDGKQNFTKFGREVYDYWKQYSIPAGDVAFEIHRSLILISVAIKESITRYKDILDRWLILRKTFSIQFLINNKVYLFLFSYLDKTINDFNPFKFLFRLQLSQDQFDESVDWNYFKNFYNDNAVNLAIDKYSNTITDYLSREGRSNICIAMELYQHADIDFDYDILNLDKDKIDLLKEIVKDFSKREGERFITEQIIYYGAPGTGKSYKVDKKIKTLEAKFYERVTFHPEYDYNSFVGGYKPISEEDKSGNIIISYKFVPQAFSNIYCRAWLDLNNQYYLVIEEINRGNCAEIFGDIFQLLDRASNYSITPSDEIKRHLLNQFGNDSSHPGIVNGLNLPPNLHILATMNTSDQSLFPMDSAFKRRWNWEYLPISYEENDEYGNKNESFDFEILLSEGKAYSWIDFISKINNEHIKNNPSLGMDKCIGNYFVKPDHDYKTISLKSFINKVVFYLWNDVFKDEDNKVFETNGSYDDFFPIATSGLKKVEELFERIEMTQR